MNALKELGVSEAIEPRTSTDVTPRMAGAPGLHSGHVHGATEILGVLALGQPDGLAGRLARAPTLRGAAIAVTLTAASIDVEKLSAIQALALSGLRHRCSPTRTATSAKSTPPAPAGTQSEEDGSGQKKTRQGR